MVRPAGRMLHPPVLLPGTYTPVAGSIHQGPTSMLSLLRWAALFVVAAPLLATQETRPRQAGAAGVVCQVNVASNNVPDVSTLEAWKKSFIKEGMSDEEKAMAVWKTVAMFQHQDSSAEELLHNEGSLTDVMKVMHVYGHSY